MPDPISAATRLFDSPITRIGVTGLSQAGKSTLITSLINHLENVRRGALKGSVALTDCVHGQWQREGIERPFDYDAGLRALTSTPPHWPDSTRDWSVARIELQFDRPWYRGGSRRRIIELVDYPGEWLLDLILIDWDFDRWCREMAQWVEDSPRRELAGQLIEELQAINPEADCDGAYLMDLQRRWAAFLADCRLPPHRMSRNLPGRFLIPGEGYDPRVQPFVPLLAPNFEAPRKADANSWYRTCRDHYEAYRRDVVRPFFETHFRRLDAQIVLVDMLGAMAAGRESLEDMQAAIDAVLQPFRYDDGGWLGRLFQRRIRRVAVCATQIDHVLPEDQTRLQQLMESYLFETVQRLAGHEIEMEAMAISAVRAARLAESERPEAGLIGRDKRTGQRIRFTPPTLPTHMPHDLDLKIDELPRLAPPEGLDRMHTFPGRRIDRLIDFLLR